MLLLYLWVLTAGRWDFLQRQFFDDFFDLQSRAMLDGRLNVPADRVGFEGFVTGGKTYIYFGIVPSLLRMPILALTDQLDGRLTTLSMTAAVIVLMVATFRLTCVIRAMVRGNAPVAGAEPWLTTALAVATLMAPPFFLASAATVYHEATLWALGLSIAGFDAVARWQRDPTGRRLAVASLLITAAILSRWTVALGPLAALALSAATRLWQMWRDADRADSHEPLRRVARGAGAVALAGLLPLGLSMAVNQAKFRQLVGVPADRQAFAGGMGNRQEVLRVNPSYVGIEYLPTDVWQYFGPNGIELRRDFPWIDFPRDGPTKLNDDAVYDVLDWCSSLPATMPALLVLAVGGLAWSIRSRRSRDPANRFVPLLLGAVVGSATVVVFPYIANRYLNDLYPLVFIPGLIGFHALAGGLPSWRAAAQRAAVGGMGLLVVMGMAVNLALALEYQRERGPAVPDDWRAEWVGWRVDAPGAPRPVTVDVEDSLPQASDGGLLVVGDCDGLYVGVRDDWLAVERGPGVGVHDLRVDLDQLPVGERSALLTLGHGGDATEVALVRVDDGRVRVDVRGPGSTDKDWLQGEPNRLGGEITLRVTADRRQPANNVFHDTQVLNLVPPPRGDGATDVTLGPGVERVGADTSVCETALDRN